jgi:sec-independent protein translocase protein TatA
MPQFGFLDLGAPELIIVLVILLLLFGSKKLPDLSRSIGQSMHELRKGMSDGEPESDKTDKTENDKKEKPPQTGDSTS